MIKTIYAIKKEIPTQTHTHTDAISFLFAYRSEFCQSYLILFFILIEIQIKFITYCFLITISLLTVCFIHINCMRVTIVHGDIFWFL